MTRLIPVIIGPTAVGKTDLSVAIARHVSGEIVSADSRQLYRYLDIGTAKPTAAQRQAVPHHLIDRLSPDKGLDVACFERMAWGCIHNIEARGKHPLIVGGSGMYIRALTDGLFRGPGAHPHLRAALGAEAQATGVQVLHDRLAQVDPQAASRIHPHDRVRIIRALEVYTLTGRPISHWQQQWQNRARGNDFILIGLSRTPEDLRQRIAARTRGMLAQGLEAEVKRLLSMGFASTLATLQSLGYGEMLAYLAGEIDLPRTQALIEGNTWRLAKRQMTWFRRIEGIQWVSLTDKPEASAIEAIIARITEVWARTAGGRSLTYPNQQGTLCACLTMV
jgi:tRNA dimethylallyltransferase